MQANPASASARATAVVTAVVVLVVSIVASAGGPMLAASAASAASAAAAVGRPVRGGPVDPGNPKRTGAVTYRPPVNAPVLDPFRPPLTPYGPGNRGIDYATVAGTPVLVAADGLVVFAGPVAGGLHVTVLHGDGVRTTYSYLAAIRVPEGQVVRSGDVVGLAAATLHVGARRGDTYIDPATLWGRPVGPPAVHLVPLDGGRRDVGAILTPDHPRLVPAAGASLAGLAGGAPQGAAAGIGAPSG